MRLLEHANNVYSQTGEDGVLAKILSTLETQDQWCVEFGAWDGKHLSNTARLIDSGYSAVLIEGDKVRFRALSDRFGEGSKVIVRNCFVGFAASDGLDSILEDTPIPRDFDLLSIDIDGNDYHVWKAISLYVPKVVCIEYNPTIATEVDFVQPADTSVNQGASLAALTRLGRSKGYALVAATAYNAIFVRSEYFDLFNIADNSPGALREDTSAVTHIFCGYDGTIFIRGANQLHWHGCSYSARIRQIPKRFRRFPDNYGPMTSWLFRTYRKLSRFLGRW